MYSITDRGAEFNRPFLESGAITIFYFSLSAENVGSFYFLLFFGPKMKLLFRYFLFFGQKEENPFTVGLYTAVNNVAGLSAKA